MRGGGGQKISAFVHTQGIKTVHSEGGQKKAKLESAYSFMLKYSKRTVWSFNNYVDRILPFFDPPSSPAWTVFIP